MLVPIAVAVPAVAAALIVVSGDRPRLHAMWTALAAAATFALVASMFGSVLDGDEPAFTIGSLAPDLELALRVDAAGMVFAASASALWILASSFSFGYVRGAREQHRTRFFSTFAVCVSETIGLAFAANLFTFFVFYELLTLATYPLVVHKQTPEALAAGRRYLFTLLGGGTAVLLAVAVVHIAVPGAEFTPGGVLDGAVSDAGVVALVVLAVLGFGTKAAIMPFHQWLPAAMVAPTPVSALLHAVAVVKAGVFGFARMFGYVIGPERLADVGAGAVVASVAAVTIVVASVVAFRQDQLKRRLAYSTIAHLSYIVLGLSLLSASAWNGAMLHLANHAVLKITLFFCAGAIYVTTGVDRVSQMDGIGRRMPVTMAAFGIAALGLAGVPPVSGFVSKWFLGLGALDAGEPLLAAVVIGSGLLTAGYLLPIVFRAFFRSSPDFPVRAEASPLMVVPIATTAAVGLALGLGDVVSLGELTAAVGAAVTGGRV
ncbi:MAG TPA: proton-conducting transporter membrane subunit [Acidimicrobiales bacterium]|nr:proton-conducting transporter membrane subunit [Acidimicrobiales bacterium]